MSHDDNVPFNTILSFYLKAKESKGVDEIAPLVKLDKKVSSAYDDLVHEVENCKILLDCWLTELKETEPVIFEEFVDKHY